ncbi:unnamed protein product [Schistocephalus solidus]|uniref:Secreted protein n=1 Tax=Schistocephalus solidus TaxID=70667 RepID=A0A183SGE3_SCHSO|nr:unnamed protein product [Schistocephalus solidus]
MLFRLLLPPFHQSILIPRFFTVFFLLLAEVVTKSAAPFPRLLIKHFINSNRPGSRLHHCAQDLSAYVERRLAELDEQNSAVAGGDEDPIRSQPTLP